jgi:hypothetical protein
VKKIESILLLTVLCSGCATQLQPSLAPVDKFPIAEITTQPVKIINAQTATEDIALGSSGTGMGQLPKTIYGNLHGWTEIACFLLTTELYTRTAKTDDKTSRELRLSITKIAIEPITFLGGNAVKLHVNVTTGSGITKEFEVEHTNASRRNLEQNAGGALAKVVATILNDEAIRKYLQN